MFYLLKNLLAYKTKEITENSIIESDSKAVEETTDEGDKKVERCVMRSFKSFEILYSLFFSVTKGKETSKTSSGKDGKWKQIDFISIVCKNHRTKLVGKEVKSEFSAN